MTNAVVEAFLYLCGMVQTQAVMRKAFQSPALDRFTPAVKTAGTVLIVAFWPAFPVIAVAEAALRLVKKKPKGWPR